MPWHLETRDGEVCVIQTDNGKVAGCHSSRADAIKQQRALYANESRMASMYAALDELDTEALHEAWPEPDVKLPDKPSELVKIEIGKENEVLTASLLQRMDEMSAREQETQMALVAALHAIGTRSPVVNVEAPNVNVEPPSVTVEPPAVTVEAPEVRVEAPSVSVNPEIFLPEQRSTKTVTFNRDFNGDVTSAEVTEVSE